MVKTTSRISKWQNTHYSIVNGRSIKQTFNQVYGENYNTMEKAISAAINMTIPIRHARDYIISYDGILYGMRHITDPSIRIEKTKFVNFKYIIRKAYNKTNFKCSNLDEEEQEFIDAIHAMRVEDKLTI